MRSPSSPANSSVPHEQGALAMRISVMPLFCPLLPGNLKCTRPFPGPALNHNLLLGVELHRVLSLRVQIAEKAVLPAGEREERHWGSDADIDADVAGLNLVAEFPGPAPTPGEETAHIAIRGGVDQLNGLIKRLSMHQAEHRAENLGAGQFSARIHLVYNGPAHKV